MDLTSQDLPPEFVLFGEDASRVLISCDRANLAGIEQIAGKCGISAEVIGETISDNLVIKVDGRVVVSSMVGELRNVYENALEGALKTDPELVAAD
jgi:hypothetical protein